MVRYDNISRIHILDAWVAYYQGKPVDFILGHSTALGDKLELQLRAYSRRRYHTTLAGLNRYAMMRLVGFALGVHRQIVATVRRSELAKQANRCGSMGAAGGNRYTD